MNDPIGQAAATPIGSRPALKGAAPRACLALSRAFMTGPLRRFALRRRAPNARFESQQNYLAERVSAAETYRQLFAEFCTFTDKTVLELGCSTGYLLAAFLDGDRFQAIGADISPEVLAKGRSTHRNRITFVRSTASAIPLPDASVDVIYTVDTVEHLSQPREIFTECWRVLRPGGRLLAHFHPWLGPWGSHLEDIIPFPWPQVLFSMDTLLTVAAHLYESDDYVPACYWVDPTTGQRRPNPYLDHERWREFLNHMTVSRFRSMLRTLPFRVVHMEPLGFGGRAYGWARAFRGLARQPLLDEFFSNAVFCVLERPR